jgi:N-acetylglucosamine-6-sulfatase
MPARTWRASVLRQILVTLLACAASTIGLGAHPGPVVAAERPNIVMFYIDDTSPHDGRLWNNPARTPAIHNTFIEHGIHFNNAFVEDPLCCPARATLLTGLHTHNNGVDVNEARFFSPQETVAGKLKDAGYSTMWIGKYMNFNNKLSTAGWAAHMAPWSVFDGIYGVNGAFYDYTVRTKDQGDIKYGRVHSTRMVADRAISRFAAVPADKPIFAVLTVYNTHEPNTPMPITRKQKAMCQNIGSWWTPAYNEPDVSDKPAYIRNLPLLPYADGWPLAKYCREMFGVDKLVKRVTDELAAEGRLDNTLLIFTADNGSAWGAHRKGQIKAMPYATPVPLYMAWPARWGTAPREIDDFVTNIDFAPTFCELGGCTMGPYPTGQAGADGLSLVNLIGDGTPLGRDAILSSALIGEAWRKIPGWAAVRTTTESGLGLWHYVEYATGEFELYDEAADPYELNNLAGDPDYAAVEADLAQGLAALLSEGRVERPDLSIWMKKANSYAGYFRFASAPTPEQTLNATVQPGQTYVFKVRLKNNETNGDSFKITSTTAGGGSIQLKWIRANSDVTGQMAGSGIVLSSLASSFSGTVTLEVKVSAGFAQDAQATIEIDAESVTDASRDDHVTLVLSR